METKVINGIAYMKSSKNRQKVLNSLNENMKIPSEISKDTNIRLNHVSALLKELKDNDLVECLNEESKKGRLYTLTKIGKKVIEFQKK